MIHHDWESPRVRWVRRGILCLLILTLVLLTTGLQSARAAESAITVRFNEETLQLGTNPVLQNGTTLVPMRPLFEALDISLAWDPVNKTVRGTKSELDVSLTIGSKQARINGTSVTLAEAAVIRNGFTLVPLRFVSEASNALVLWDPYSRQVLVYDDAFFQDKDFTKQELQQQFQQYLEERRKEAEQPGGGSSGGGNGGGGNDRMCSVWRYHPIYGGSLEWVPC
ncbi:copper amine oxidase N-terminal domain-containing protein [Paenibacillus daejeonensis]|uniref:copper amine oxidase N-terminal domain-containing protein n=1 Tax=Paenibacillus daejeonensis TaxID=135193 RepID=UPI0003688850|nr:copper amine oxidase N-terminal domain-containing protein [Paenibacillus daejeonensis]